MEDKETQRNISNDQVHEDALEALLDLDWG